MNPSPHRFRGPLRAVVLDWAGTTVDHGSLAPVVALVRLFEAHGVPISVEQARGPMGLAKRDHIGAVLDMPDVAARWAATQGRPWQESDLDALFAAFVPLQLACLADFADPIPGVLDTVAAIRARGLAIGSTTGYTRAMMERLAPESARRGYAPDVWVSSTDVPAGRPSPWMAYQNAVRLGVSPMLAMVKIGDTPVDIEEGLNAGMWTIAVARTGNELGLATAEVAALSPAELEHSLAPIRQRLRTAGAHFVVDSLADCLSVLDTIDRLLAEGQAP